MRDWLKRYFRGFRLIAGVDDLRAWANLVGSLPTVDRLSQIFSAGSYDIIHANNTFTYQAPTLLAAKRSGAKVIAHVRNPLRDNVLSRWLLLRASLVVTVNRTLERELRRWDSPVDVRTCHDPVELPSADSCAARALRASLVPRGVTLVGSIGRLEEQKGYHCLIDAAARVIEKHRDVHFVIAGEGSFRPLLQRRIDELELKNHFHLCGFKEDAVNFLAALDIFVSSSLWEGGPMTLIEALLLNKPVVATTVGVSSEIVVPGQNGELVPPSDPEALAGAISLVLEKIENYPRKQARIREFLRIFADPTSSALVFDEMLDQVAGPH
jgi:glycosyltransferase involved in cell wall biosynthesis